jgi:paraquat-inducible protein B
MAVEKSYTRLGLFIVVALLVVLATAVLFIQRMRSRDTIGMVTYTTEDVSGLDVSSPVRYRGVPLGRVTNLRVDPETIAGRGGIIEIDFEVFLDRLNTVGANVRAIRKIADTGGVFPKLRARIVGNPVTGEAYLLLDFPQNAPPPIELGFKPTRPYVPSMPSTFTTVQDRLPELLDRAEATLQTLEKIVTRIPNSLDRNDRFFDNFEHRSDQFFTNVEHTMQESQLPGLSADSRRFFTTTSGQMEQITSQIEQITSQIKDADVPGTAQSARDAADSSRLAADDLRRSLPAIRDSLEQMRELARHLEEQPESIVYGPRPQHEKR